MDTIGLETLVVAAAGLFTVTAVSLSVRHIYLHLSHYIVPKFQLHVVRLLAMVPIYSLTSWLALLVSDERVVLVLDVLRDTYEAYVIYNFVILLINYGGGHLHLCRYLEGQPRMEHPFPLHLWLPPLKLGPGFLSMIRVSVLQFVFVKPVNACLKLYLSFHDDVTYRSFLNVCIIIVNNVSVSVALYGLVLFYHAAIDLLQPFGPFAKFISVKAVVFFSFWQGFVLSTVAQLGLLPDVPDVTADELATSLQDVLICFEMAVAAIAHIFVFSYTEYDHMDVSHLPHHHNNQHDVAIDGVAYSSAQQHPLLHVVDFRDVLSDAKDRLDGSVGYGTELMEGAPIVAGSAFPAAQGAWRPGRSRVDKGADSGVEAERGVGRKSYRKTWMDDASISSDLASPRFWPPKNKSSSDS